MGYGNLGTRLITFYSHFISLVPILAWGSLGTRLHPHSVLLPHSLGESGNEATPTPCSLTSLTGGAWERGYTHTLFSYLTHWGSLGTRLHPHSVLLPHSLGEPENEATPHPVLLPHSLGEPENEATPHPVLLPHSLGEPENEATPHPVLLPHSLVEPGNEATPTLCSLTSLTSPFTTRSKASAAASSSVD